MGLTAPMDHDSGNEARMRIVEPAIAPAPRVLEVVDHDDCRRITLEQNGDRRLVRVHRESEDARTATGSIATLLTELSGAGVTGSPRVLENDGADIVLEAASPMRPTRGRRRAEGGSPDEAERRAQAQAREVLEELVDAVHARGWVVGLEGDEGVGLREDCSVMLMDVSRMHPSEDVLDRLADQSWITRVLRDEQRTLRRRIDRRITGDVTPDKNEGMQWYTPPPPREEGAAEHPAHGRGSRRRRPSRSRARRRSRRSSVRREATGRTAQGWAGAVGRRLGHALRSTVRRVGRFRSLPAGEKLMASVAVVLTVAILTGTAVGIAGVGGPQQVEAQVPRGSTPSDGVPSADDEVPPPADTTSVSPDADPDTSSGTSGADSIGPMVEDPVALTEELLEARYAYLTSPDEEAVAVPGSPADLQGEQVRDAYAAVEVDGDPPVVHEAQWVEVNESSGRARVRAQVEQPAQQVTRGDGDDEKIPAQRSTWVELDLRAFEDRWLLFEVIEQQ